MKTPELENQTASPEQSNPYYPAKSAEARREALRALRGMWKDHNPDPIQYFENLRQEAERELPPRSC